MRKRALTVLNRVRKIVAHLGWVGIRLEGRPPWKQIEAILREAAQLANAKPIRARLRGSA